MNIRRWWLLILFCFVAIIGCAERPTPHYMLGYGLFENITIEEQAASASSNNQYWWLNSGGYFHINNGVGRTSFGELPVGDRWQRLYADGSRTPNNPIDTDGGKYPQNLFRLYTRTKWGDYIQQVYFRLRKTNQTESPQRNQSNGILFFNRGVDGNNLYYNGLRVDGDAVFKKKIGGNYEVALDQRSVFPGKYDKDSNPNLIPHNTWIGLRCVVKTVDEIKVKISLYMDLEETGHWKLVSESVDNLVGGPAFLEPGFAGIRTDFMDVEFRGYQLISLNRQTGRGR